ncbi:MAG: hypothetical protein AAF216_11140 [Pseudomonadota bacterium]
MMKSIVFPGLVAVLVAAPASAQYCAEQSISWTEGGAKHTTVIEGRVRNGCPMVRQTITPASGEPISQTGMDCDCDLVIDGAELTFTPPLAIVSGRMKEVCAANKASYTPWNGARVDSAS